MTSTTVVNSSVPGSSVGNITRWTVYSSSGFGSQLEGNYNTAGGGSVSAEYRFDGNISNNLVTSVTTDGKIRYKYLYYVNDYDFGVYHMWSGEVYTSHAITIIP